MRRSLLTVIPALASVAVHAQDRPNIILFMVDDMGWQDTSLPFDTVESAYNRRYRTPNMERLARQGMMMTQAYASPISSPSRCSLMTGTNAARHAVTNWTFAKDTGTDAPDTLLDVPRWNVNGISPVDGIPGTYRAVSFVELLRRNGYHTIHIGKAHWGAQGTPGEDPLNWGFEVNIAGHAAGGPATYLSEKRYGHDGNGSPASRFAVPGLEKYWDSGAFLTEALTREAIARLDMCNDRPFYLYMSHYAVHVPIDRDMRYYESYIRQGLSGKEAAYASLIEGMDTSLGEIMDWVEKHSKRSTVIIFMSDNGGYCTGSQWRDEPLYTQNSPLKCGKGSLYEGGIREPMIVSWPGHVEAGSRCNGCLLIEDFFPTILEIAGIRDFSVPQTVDGVSFLPSLLGKRFNRGKDLIWNFPNVWDNEGPGISLNCAIRSGRWKLIYSYGTGRKELYDIPSDISEEHDLSLRYPEITRRLSSRLGRLLRSCGAQRPSYRSTGEPCPWPDGK